MVPFLQPFFRHELSKIGVAINPSKIAALPPKGHVSKPEEIVLVGGIGVRVAEGGGEKVVGVPIGNIIRMESAVGLVRDAGGAEKLARMVQRTACHA